MLRGFTTGSCRSSGPSLKLRMLRRGSLAIPSTGHMPRRSKRRYGPAAQLSRPRGRGRSRRSWVIPGLVSWWSSRLGAG